MCEDAVAPAAGAGFSERKGRRRGKRNYIRDTFSRARVDEGDLETETEEDARRAVGRESYLRGEMNVLVETKERFVRATRTRIRHDVRVFRKAALNGGRTLEERRVTSCWILFPFSLYIDVTRGPSAPPWSPFARRNVILR